MQDGLNGLLPEEFPYGDDGCELWAHCLDCPFSTCIKEEPWGVEKFTKLQRARRMAELKQEGNNSKEIGRIFGVSTRTVQRWLKMLREVEGRDSSVALLPQNDKVGGLQ